VYKFDKSRLDLARELKANPFERWTLALLEPGGNRAPKPTNTVFTDLREAEWHVFKLRWVKLAGEELPTE